MAHDKLNDPVNLTSGGNKASTNQYALFIKDEWRIAKPLAFVWMAMKHNGDRWSPCAYLVWNGTDALTVKGEWSTAFKASSMLQLSSYWASNSCRVGCRIVGSPELKSKISESF